MNAGNSGLKVSPVCLGITNSIDTACAAYDMGFNFFFLTADMHWPAYETARKGLARLLERGNSIREKIVVAAVNYPTQLEFCTAPFEELVDEIEKLKKIDILVVGGSYSADFFARLREFQRLKEEGFAGAKAIGTTFHEREAAILPVNHGLLDIAFLRYNTSHPGARIDVFPYLQPDRHSLVFCFKSTMGWFPEEEFPKLGLSDEYWRPGITDHYRFVLSNKAVDGLLCAPGDIQEVKMLVEALEKGPLSEKDEKYMIKLSQLYEGKVKLKLN